ncbi:EAL domain-containing protein [Cytobacillus sp. FJAT-53684]|uniref:EAL domain-containing protein n=1 Tax=Cytobacillus mangrovibacter TaxID=3299024 RepID=A0ABW6K3H1_9BACI
MNSTLYKDIFDQLHTCAIISDQSDIVVSVNTKFIELSGFASEEMIGMNIEAILNGKYELNEQWNNNVFIMKKDGSTFSQRLSVKSITDALSGEEYKIWLLTDFKVCNLDPLTNLPNRNLLDQKLTQAINRAREESTILAVLFLDLDRFKFVNDTLGHSSGDQLLTEASVRIKEVIGEENVVARMGGDEFVCFLEDLSSEKEAELFAKRIILSFSKPFSLKETEMYITTSIGISLYPFDGDEVEQLITNADSAMYRAKKKGRNQYEKAKADVNAGGFEKLLLENNLRRALERDELTLYFQPQVDLKTNQIKSLEALIRWNHPDLGLISPGDFIPIAEESGLIVPIGDWVLRTACIKMKEWQNAGYPPVRIAVNLSAGQFLKSDLVKKVKTILEETGLAPSYLELEITENMVMHDVHLAIQVLRQLKEIGIQISIDDFGTGYSSLNYLKEFPVDTLKIDRSFIRDIDKNPSSVALTKAITTLAHDLNLKVIAEGVENFKQLSVVKQHSCDAVQGFYFSRPLSYENVVHYLNDHDQKVSGND